MREGMKFGLRTLGKYLVLFILSLMFVGTMVGQLWLQALLNLVFLAGFALLTLNEAGAIGERAETLRVTLEQKRAAGEAVDPAMAAKAYRPATAVTGFFVAAAPLLIIALLNLASLPSNPQSLDPANFAPVEAAELDAALQEAALAADPAAEAPTPVAGVLPVEEADAPEETAPEAPADEAELAPLNIFNTVARLAFSPFISLYGLLNNQLLLLYLLMVPLSFLLPAFALAGYLKGPKLREKKLEAIKKGIRAKKRKERRARKPSSPKPEV